MLQHELKSMPKDKMQTIPQIKRQATMCCKKKIRLTTLGTAIVAFIKMYNMVSVCYSNHSNSKNVILANESTVHS